MKISIWKALNELYKIWLLSLMITIGIVIGIIIFPSTLETGTYFLIITLFMILFQVGFLFHFYEYSGLDKENNPEFKLIFKK